MDPFDTSCAAVQAVEAVIDHILSVGADKLYDHYLQDREASFAVSRVLGELSRVVDLAYLPGDGEHHGDTSGMRPWGLQRRGSVCPCSVYNDMCVVAAVVRRAR